MMSRISTPKSARISRLLASARSIVLVFVGSLLMIGVFSIGSTSAFRMSTIALTALPVSSGLRLWLRSDIGVNVDGNGKVQTWADQSGSGNDFTQNTANARPTLAPGAGPFGADVLRFDGVDDVLQNASQIVAGTSVTVFTVMSVREPGYPWALGTSLGNSPTSVLNKRLFYEGHPVGGVTGPDFFDVTHDWGNEERASFPGINDDQYKVLSITGSNKIHNIRAFVNGTPAVMTATGSNTDLIFSPGNTLGSVHSTPNEFTEVDLAEFIVYDRELNQSERDSVEAYLISRYFPSVQPATLGNYPNTSVQLSGNAAVMPDAAPTGATSITVASSTSFKGTFAADPMTGVVRVINAHPQGTYPVTVTASGSGGAATKSFTLTVTTPPACNPVSFANAASLTVNGSPAELEIGDFNEDGNQDLAVADSRDNSVSIRLGDGTGGFSGATTVPVGANPITVRIADFNGDGHQDFITANFHSSSVSVRLGDGAGGFSGTTNFNAGPDPLTLTLGDFNGDGKTDVATANYFAHIVSILLGDGAGGFSGTTTIPVGSNPTYVVVGDFNGDGKQDLAVANSGANNVSIKLGDGAGGFSGTTTIPVGPNPRFIGSGDFNNDGKLDLATANFNTPTVSIRLGDGAGGFGGTTEVSAGSNPIYAAIGDFDGDGNQDLIVSNLTTTYVSIRLGDGAGGFSNAADVSVGTDPTGIAVGDFNEDGMQDFAVASGSVYILLRQCLNTTPTINAIGVARQANGVTSNSQIATVNDVEDAENTLALTVNGGASATVNGVTVSGISVDPSGTVTANVSSACGAATANFTLRVTDSNGAWSEATLTVTVTAETTPPSITCPPNEVQSTDPNLCTAVVTYANATATDNCSGVGTPSCSPASGSAFPKGVNTVTCVVSDASGNTASCTFTVTVNDTQPPSLTCPADVTANKPANACSVAVSYSTPPATDNCSTASVACSPPSGSSFPVGSTTVVCTATDTALNTASCSFTINVVNHAPTVNAGGPYTVPEGGSVSVAASGNDSDGDTLAFAWDLDNNGSFEASGMTVNFSAALLDGPGSRIIRVQVTDSCGSSTIAQATVNVVNVPPTVGAITAPVNPNPVNTTINAGASFTDPGVLDTHTAVWNWGDGGSSAGTVNETNGSGSVSGSHAYSTAGVYTLTLTVTDKDGGSGQAVFQYVVVYDPLGAFVIGDLVNLTGGATVYFWGSQWEQNNPMSGGSGPNAFKGFEDGTATPACGGTWTSSPGNSSNPPPTVPQFMAVIVTSSVQKSGPVITGNVRKIVIIETNPGYGPSPGHVGTGRVVAIICGGP